MINSYITYIEINYDDTKDVDEQRQIVKRRLVELIYILFECDDRLLDQ